MNETKHKNPAAVSLGSLGGKIGGKSTTERKRKAAIANGKKGGRPPILKRGSGLGGSAVENQ